MYAKEMNYILCIQEQIQIIVLKIFIRDYQTKEISGWCDNFDKLSEHSKSHQQQPQMYKEAMTP